MKLVVFLHVHRTFLTAQILNQFKVLWCCVNCSHSSIDMVGWNVNYIRKSNSLFHLLLSGGTTGKIISIIFINMSCNVFEFACRCNFAVRETTKPEAGFCSRNWFFCSIDHAWEIEERKKGCVQADVHFLLRMKLMMSIQARITCAFYRIFPYV